MKKDNDEIYENDKELKKKLDDLVERDKALGRIYPLEDAFKENPVELEVHKGNIEYFIGPIKETYNDDEIYENDKEFKKKLDDLVERAKKNGDIHSLDEAFEKYPTEFEEWEYELHDDEITYYSKKKNIHKQKKYSIGDIVFVNNYSYDNKNKGTNHLFVIIDSDNHIVPLDYFGFIISSNIQKSKEVSKFKYNEPIKSNTKNGLNKDSIVKCEKLFKISVNNIEFKIGKINKDELNRFIKAHNTYIKNLNAITN